MNISTSGPLMKTTLQRQAIPWRFLLTCVALAISPADGQQTRHAVETRFDQIRPDSRDAAAHLQNLEPTDRRLDQRANVTPPRETLFPHRRQDRHASLRPPRDHAANRFPDAAHGGGGQVRLTTAVEPAGNADDNGRPLTKESVDQQIKQIADAVDLTDEIRAECQKRLAKALEWLQVAADASQRIAEYQAEIRQSDEVLAETKTRLAQQAATAPQGPVDGVELAELEQHLASLETALKQARQQLAKREDDLKKRGQRKSQLASLLAETTSRLKEARDSAKAPAPEDEDPRLSASKGTEIAARIRGLEQQLQMYQVEGERHEALGQALPLMRDLAAQEVAAKEQLFSDWQSLVANRRKREADKQAEEARRRAEQAHPALRQLAERNAYLTEVRSELAKKIETIAASLKSSETQATMLRAQLDSATERVAKAGHTTSVGIMLRKLRERLPTSQVYEQQQQFVSQEMPNANLQRLELEEERSELSHLDGAVVTMLSELDGTLGELGPQAAQRYVREILGTKRDVLDQLLKDFDSYLESLSKLEVTGREVLQLRQQLSGFVDEHVLWIRSTRPLGIAFVRELPSAASALISPEPWRSDARSWWSGITNQPLLSAAAILFVLLLLIARDQVRRRLKLVSNASSARAQLSLSPTLQSAAYTLLMASQWPALVYAAGWFLLRWEHAGAAGPAIGKALCHTAFLFWIIELGWQACRSGGLAENHFRWTSAVLGSIRVNLQWFRLASLPTLFASSFAAYYRDGQFSDSLGRVAFILVWSAVGVLIHRLLRPQSAISRDLSMLSLEGWLARLWSGLYFIALVLPIVLIGLAVIGYHFSAQELAVRFEITLALILATILAHELVSHWILIKRRAIALREAKEAQAQAHDTSTDGHSSPVTANGTAERRDLHAIHEQIRILLRHAMTIGLVIGLWFTWVNVLPALRILDRVELWTTNIEVTELIQTPDGKSTTSTVDRMTPITLRHLFVAIAILVVASALGKNFPALLEFTILDRLPIDGAARHAAAFLMRYAISVGAIILACRSLHVTWSSVQWLAAAMTVGLGFGLQEIFANLVSGLIILFERPVRVGDIVTVGQVTGTVSAMRMRATTITDFDRRELVVPNKKFITEDVMNWTLSDRISRIVIPVGIAYGSDTSLAHATLVRVAREHPLVLEDPEPTALFKGFGDSTLNFDLRVFIPNRDVYAVVVHEINSAIDFAFREAHIEIAFPQRDINIRAAESLLSVVDGRPRNDRKAA